MPIIITELDNGFGCIIKGEGIVTGEELFNALSEHVSKPEKQLKKYLYTISDYTEITDSDVSLKYLYKCSLIVDDVANVNRNALIVTAAPDPTLYYLAKLYSQITKLTGWKFGVFRNRDDLDQWLIENLGEKYKKLDLKFDSE